MRTIAMIAVLSLTASLQVATDNTPSSFTIDLLEESLVINKEIDELDGLEDFETEEAASPSSGRRTSVIVDSQSNTQDSSDGQSTSSQSDDENIEDELDSGFDGADSPQDGSSETKNPERSQEADEPETGVPDEEQPQDTTTSDSETETYTLLTEPLETEGFHVAGVTWEGAPPQQVDVRALSNGEWTEWFNLEIDDNGGNDGSEPIMAAGSEGIQVRATGKVLPESFDVHLMTGEGNNGTKRESKPREADDQPAQGTELEPAENVSFKPIRDKETHLLSSATSSDHGAMQLASTQRAANMQSVPFSQNIVTRTQWGAPREATWRTQYATLQGAVVHHTDGSNTYTRSQAPGIVKGIWNYHTYTREWGDIGYNFLIDKYGTVYEGRSGSIAAKPGEMAIGAHAAPANTGSVGISVLGSYTGSVNPSNQVLNTIADVIAWQFAMADINPSGKFTYRTANGSSRTTNAVSGHRDISATACPGNIYPRLSTIRSSAASKMAQYTQNQSPTFVRAESSGKGWPQDNAWSMGDFSGNGTTDLLLRNSSGRIFLYKGRGDNTFANGVQIGHGWNGFKELYTGVDFDGDSIPDILGINRSNQLYLYPGNGQGRLKQGRQIGHGWSFEHLIIFEDGPGKNPAIAGIKANGSMILYSTNGRGRFTSNRSMGSGFSNLVGAVAVGDWDRSGFSDLVNVSSSGRLQYYSDPTENGFSGSTQIGRGWAGLTILPGDTSGQHHDLITISRDRRLSTYIFSR